MVELALWRVCYPNIRQHQQANNSSNVLPFGKETNSFAKKKIYTSSISSNFSQLPVSKNIASDLL